MAARKDLKPLDLHGVTTAPMEKSLIILRHSHESSQAMLNAFHLARIIRGWKSDKSGELKVTTLRGMTTDEEQDLLRAMVVSAASGLDAMLKQLIRDALPHLLDNFDECATKLQGYVESRLKGDAEIENSPKVGKFLSTVLIAESPRKQLIEEYLDFLTRGSLQSSGELEKAVLALGLDAKKIGIDHKVLKPIFDMRNKIIHELDVNLDAPKRNRNVRKEETMRESTDRLLQIAAKILKWKRGRSP